MRPPHSGPSSTAEHRRTWLRHGLHASLAVKDLEASLRFYVSLFGFECTFRADDLTDEVARLTGQRGLACRLAQMKRPGEGVVELIEFAPADGSRPASGTGTVPTGHLAFAVEDLDDALADVGRAGAEPLGEIVPFPEGRCVYCREPGGSVFEFEELAGGEHA